MGEYVNVAVDAMGGDNAPGEIVKGAVEAIHESKKVKVYLVGKEDAIRAELTGYTYPEEQLTVVPASEIMRRSCIYIGAAVYKQRTAIRCGNKRRKRRSFHPFDTADDNLSAHQ